MPQTAVPSTQSSLLEYAVSRLRPDVFQHPVWMRFGTNEVPPPPGRLDDLMLAARDLQAEDPSAACQVLLLCAVYLVHGGQPYSAQRTVQQVISLAETASLDRELIWALWGACAVSLQQGNRQAAAEYLIDLQAAFSRGNEWVLSNLIDVLRQCILQPQGSPALGDGSLGDALGCVLGWLQHWGFPPQDGGAARGMEPMPSAGRIRERSARLQSFLSIQYWRGRLRSLMLAFRGELRLQWIEREGPSAGSRSTLSETIREILKPQRRDGEAGMPVSEVAQSSSPALLAPPDNAVPPPADRGRKRSGSGASTGRRKRNTERPVPRTAIAIQMLGPFGITIGSETVKLPASRGLSVFKYLLLRYRQRLTRDVLMDTFWPDAEPETARNNLNVALHKVRQALRTVTDLPVILFEGGAYGLAPDLQVWLDVDEFEKRVRAGMQLEAHGQSAAAVKEYEIAVSLYRGDLLEETPYEEWTILDRERLRTAYLETLDRLSQIYFRQELYSACRSACQLILASDPCREDAHCLLMRCYSRQGQHHLAMYQYQRCVEALREELDVEPAAETTRLSESIRRREPV